MSIEITKCPKCGSVDIKHIKTVKLKSTILSDTVQFECNNCAEIFNSEEYNPSYRKGKYLI